MSVAQTGLQGQAQSALCWATELSSEYAVLFAKLPTPLKASAFFSEGVWVLSKTLSPDWGWLGACFLECLIMVDVPQGRTGLHSEG